MNKSGYDNISCEELLDKYVSAILERAELMKQAKAKKANIQYEIIRRIYEELKRRGELKQLVSLLGHNNDEVKLWAACQLHTVEVDLARTTLKQLVNSNSSVAFEAKMFLSEWERLGELKFSHSIID